MRLEVPLRLARLTLLPLIIGAALLTLDAQQASQEPAVSSSRSLAYLAPFVPSVAGAPFMATFAIRTEQPGADGSTEALQSMTKVVRDSSGRVRHELRELEPPSGGEAPLVAVVLSDPPARIVHTLDPVHRIDSRRQFDASRQGVSAAAGTAEGEDLGIRTINGLKVKGVRRTWRIPSRLDAAGQPVQAADETWYSDELQMIVLETRSDSSGRVMTVSMSQLDRHEPPASLLRVPEGYSQTVNVGRTSNMWPTMPPDYDRTGREGCCINPFAR